MRIGIFGGSFDPIHQGHLILAEQCRDQGKLDKVLFVPAPRPPHKVQQSAVSFEQRVAMLGLAIADHSQFVLDTCEQDRPGLSYTVDTLRYLHAREPQAKWFLILGGDSVRDLHSWRAPEEIASLCTLLIVDRPGAEQTAPPEYFQYERILSPLIDISSTDIRERVKLGRSIRYLLPPMVQQYVGQHQLYR